MDPLYIGLLMFGGMLVLMALRVPIAAAMFIPGALGYWAMTNDLALLNQMKGSAVARLTVYDLSVIPLFLLMGQFATQGGLSKALFQAAAAFVGHIRGGLGMSNVVACTLFGGVSGSPVADVSAMGSVMIPMMKREGYHADYAVNVTTHASLVGALMPTSHNMIIYSLAAGGKVSVGALIAAGVVPALVLTVCMLWPPMRWR